MPFGELFDAVHFMRQMLPCRFAESVPVGARWRYINVVGISKTWNYGHLLPRVYNALRAGPTVAPFLARSLRRVEEGAGLHWSAVHLRIESDWMFLAQFCVLQRYTPRRCFTPTEVAQITQAARQIHRQVDGYGLVGTITIIVSFRLSIDPVWRARVPRGVARGLGPLECGERDFFQNTHLEIGILRTKQCATQCASTGHVRVSPDPAGEVF